MLIKLLIQRYGLLWYYATHSTNFFMVTDETYIITTPLYIDY